MAEKPYAYAVEVGTPLQSATVWYGQTGALAQAEKYGAEAKVIPLFTGGDFHAFMASLPGYPWLPCPICSGTEGCDDTVVERLRATLQTLAQNKE